MGLLPPPTDPDAAAGGVSKGDGSPVDWWEILGPDPKALWSFYRDLFGWEIEEGGTEESRYGQVSQEGTGGAIGSSPDGGPHVNLYARVDDLHKYLERAESLGGKTVMRAVPELTELALANGGADVDNCTAVAMTWAGSESMDMVPPSEAPVSTLVMPDGAVASTIQFPRHGDLGADEELTEDKIDEAIAEIQRAIHRSTKLVDGK